MANASPHGCACRRFPERGVREAGDRQYFIAIAASFAALALYCGHGSGERQAGADVQSGAALCGVGEGPAGVLPATRNRSLELPSARVPAAQTRNGRHLPVLRRRVLAGRRRTAPSGLSAFRSYPGRAQARSTISITSRVAIAFITSPARSRRPKRTSSTLFPSDFRSACG